MSFPLYIAKRYLFSKSSNNAINFITLIAAFGVVIGSASLIIVLSGFAGLKDFTLKFSSFVDPDLKITASKGKTLNVTENDLLNITNIKGVVSYSKVIEERVVVSYENKNEVVTLKGVDENFPQFTVDSIMSQGFWLDYESPQIVAGWGVSNNLSFGIFDFAKSVTLYVPKPGKGQITSVKGAYNSLDVVNSGIFQINEDMDNSYVFSSLETARQLLNYNNNQITAIEVQVDAPENREAVKEQLLSLFGSNVIIRNRFQLNDALYKMLNAENLAVYLIFTLVLIIALFNIIGAIIMMILDKKKNLNTLFNLGTSVRDIRKIFFFQGSLMSLLGGALGVFLGLFVVLLQKWFGLVMLTPSLPYPVTIKPLNVVIVFVTIFVLGVLASKIAASRITKVLIKTA